MMNRIIALGVMVWAIGLNGAGGQDTRPADAPAATQPENSVTVAILDYETAAPGNKDMGSQMAEILTARLSVEPSLMLVERAQMNKILDEQKLKLVGLVGNDKAAQVGKLLGAKLLVMGKAFVMDQQLVIVTKVVGVETGLVKGSICKVDLKKPLSDTVMQMGEDIATLIRKDAANLLPENSKYEDPVAAILKAWGDKPRPSVAVIVPEHHIERAVPRPIVDPAVETEIKKTLIQCGFKVVDPGRNDLADWAKAMAAGKDKPWPEALKDADLVIVGEAFSEFALRTGDLVTCTARAEINVIDRRSGRIIVADRDTTRAVDLAQSTAGKTALQMAGRRLGVETCRKLLEWKSLSAKSAGPATKPQASGWHPQVFLGVSGLCGPSKTPPSRLEGATKTPPSGLEGATSPPSGLEGATSPPSGLEGATSHGDKSAAADRHASLFWEEGDPLVAVGAPVSATRPAQARTKLFAAVFDNATGQEQYDPAAQGMGDLVAVMLAQQDNVAVVERQKLDALAAEQARSLKGLTGEQFAVSAGKLLKANLALTGRLFLLNGKLTVNVQAIDIETSRVVAADQYTTAPESLVEGSFQVARNLAKQMAMPMPAVDLAKIDKSPLASLHFAKALSHYYAGNLDPALMQFMRAVDLDPDYTEVHYWSGLCYSKQGEHADAVIEWEQFLKDQPDSKYAPQVKKLLAEAKALEKVSAAPRLAPASAPATQPAKDSTNGQ